MPGRPASSFFSVGEAAMLALGPTRPLDPESRPRRYLMTTGNAEFLAFAHRLADASAQVILPHFRTRMDAPDKRMQGENTYSPVTVADRAAEEVMRRMINETYPDHGIWGEEHGLEKTDAEYVWLLDPIDGTRSFLTGFPIWGTLIALNRRGKVIVGIVNQPYMGERYVGSQGGAFLKEKRLKTRACAELAQAALCATSLWMFQSEAERAAFESVSQRTKLTMMTGDCYNYCMLASGFVDLVVEATMFPWDVQALIPVVEGAGGVITAWDGGPPENAANIVACGDPRLHEQVVPLLAPAMPKHDYLGVQKLREKAR